MTEQIWEELGKFMIGALTGGGLVGFSTLVADIRTQKALQRLEHEKRQEEEPEK